MMEQRPFLARIENPIQLKSCLGKNVGYNHWKWIDSSEDAARKKMLF